MTRPVHEQTWRPSPSKAGSVVNEEGVPVGSGKDAATVAAIAALPDALRALKAFLSEDGHTPECGNTSTNEYWCSQECRDGRAALRKAGVLP